MDRIERIVIRLDAEMKALDADVQETKKNDLILVEKVGGLKADVSLLRDLIQSRGGSLVETSIVPLIEVFLKAKNVAYIVAVCFAVALLWFVIAQDGLLILLNAK